MPPAPELAEVPHRDPETCILGKLVGAGGEDGSFSGVPARDRMWQWARPQVENEGPCARGGHCATLVHPPKASARIFVFGGHYDSGSKDGGGGGYVYLNDTFILDIDENKWLQPRIRGTVPEPRYGHSAALVGHRIVYFGGKGKTQNFRDLHALDTSTSTWYQGPSSGGAPCARHGHTATLQETRLFVFGGACGAKFFSDLHCLDLASMAWSAPETQGPRPTPRYGHAAVLIGATLMVHGGFCMDTSDIAASDDNGQLMKRCYKDDIRVLDLGRMLWSRLRTHGSPPTGRFGHTLVLSDDDAVMFGGWSGSTRANPGVAFAMKDKTKAAARAVDAQEDGTDSCNYCVTLRTADMTWGQSKYSGQPASFRYGHTATAIGPHLIIFGGWDGGKPLKDVVVLRDASAAEAGDEATDFDRPADYADNAEAALGFEDDDFN